LRRFETMILALGIVLVVAGAAVAFVPTYILGWDSATMLLVGSLIMLVGAVVTMVDLLWGATKPLHRLRTGPVIQEAAPYEDPGAAPSPRTLLIAGAISFVIGAILVAIPALFEATSAFIGAGAVLMLGGAVMLVVDAVFVRTGRFDRHDHTRRPLPHA
jgi:drug/metabolite transporter (DMT)-like permease